MKYILIFLFQSSQVIYLLLILMGCSLHNQHSQMTTTLDHIKNTVCSHIQPLEIELTTHLGDKQTFIEGDYVTFLASTNQDSYFLLMYKNAIGQIIQLIPSTKLGRGFYKAAYYFEIPDSRSGFIFQISEPFGEETIELFASNIHFPNFDGQILENGFKKHDPKSFYKQLQLFQQRSSQECFSFQQTRTYFISTERLESKP